MVHYLGTSQPGVLSSVPAEPVPSGEDRPDTCKLRFALCNAQFWGPGLDGKIRVRIVHGGAYSGSIELFLILLFMFVS